MDEVKSRLIRCLEAAFPGETEQQSLTADLGRLIDTDSLAGVMLLALIDEEFGVQMDLEDLIRLGSFSALQNYVRESTPPQAVPSDRVTG